MAIYPSALRKNRQEALETAILVGDVVAIALTSAIVSFVNGAESITTLLCAAAWFFWGLHSNLYQPARVRVAFLDFEQMAASTIKGALSVIVLLAVTSFAGHLNLVELGAMIISGLPLRLAARAGVRGAARSMNIADRSRVLVIGSGEVGQRVAATFIKYQAETSEVVGFVEGDTAQIGVQRVLGLPVFSANEIERVLDLENIDHVVVAFSQSGDAALVSRVQVCAERKNVRVSLVPRLFEIAPAPGRAIDVRGIPLVQINNNNRALHLAYKRAFDLTVACIAGIFALPLVAAAALAIRLDGQKQIFFRQPRPGKDGKPFDMIKLCTMRAPRPGEDLVSASRQTRVGSLLRKLSIDELPQLWNIIKGDMSLVGPRPQILEWAERFSGEIARYDDRHRMAGGLTGLAQISGLRGDTSIIERTRLDNFYIDNWSLWLDVKIILGTVTKLIPQSQGIGGDAMLKDIIAEVAQASAPIEATTVPAAAAQ